MNKLSVTIITLNEAEKLPKALESVKGLADEIVVVDSGSSDKTVEIAKKFGAKVYFNKFANYADQKNFALSKTTLDWVFSLDADEYIEEDLVDEIKKAIENEEFNAYSMPRKNIILGKFIKHARWQPELDRHIWLWKKRKGNWVGEIHEEVDVSGKVGELKNPKVHIHYETVREFVDMINKYSEVEADYRVKNGSKFSIFKMLTQPIYNFSVRYFYRLGILDGWRGFVLSYLMALYHFVLWAKVWEKTR